MPVTDAGLERVVEGVFLFSFLAGNKVLNTYLSSYPITRYLARSFCAAAVCTERCSQRVNRPFCLRPPAHCRGAYTCTIDHSMHFHLYVYVYIHEHVCLIGTRT